MYMEANMDRLSLPVISILLTFLTVTVHPHANAEDFKLVHTIKCGETRRFGMLSFSPDNKHLVVEHTTGRVEFFEVGSWKSPPALKERDEIRAPIAFSPHGGVLAGETPKGHLKLWSSTTFQAVATLSEKSNSLCLAFSSDGKTLAAGDTPALGISLWDVMNRKLLHRLEGHEAMVTSVSFSPDGKVLASGSADGTIRLWQVTTGKNLGVWEGPATVERRATWIFSVAFSPDGKLLATGSAKRTQFRAHDAGIIKIWDPKRGKALVTLEGHSNSVATVAFSPDGRTLVSGSDDQTVKVWDVNTWKNTVTLKGHSKEVWCVSYSSDGKLLACGSADGTVNIWETPTKGKDK
jgi:WD40 repeat protein